ncbi:MAG TPA: pirin family protein [Candidatus Limnocylindrales bacterium]|nr:pirin family protein [Candidatus Limnocylindrales bacterium]
MTIRRLDRIIPSLVTSDGAGVRLRRSLGTSASTRVDPFLMLDEFYSDDPRDYMAGFPPHPHRGFETVTYMLDGHMQHRDNRGHTGDLGPGDVQWMTAARGIIHSEMPQQTEGRMRGFQLWINLPASEKMQPAAYRDIAAGDIPVVELDGGARVKVIAGELEHEGGTTGGAVRGRSTQPRYFDVHLPPRAALETPVPAALNALLYPYDGDVFVGEMRQALDQRTAGVLGEGDTVRIEAGEAGARLLLIAGKPIREPIVQRGPFVMNTAAEIEQAISDYQSGAF